MTDLPRRIQPFDPAITGDCEADPVPALWDQDEDYVTGAGFIEKLWMPISIVVLAGWAGLSVFMFNLFGWWAVAAMLSVVALGSGAAVALVKSGSRADEQIASIIKFSASSSQSEAVEDRRLRKAA